MADLSFKFYVENFKCNHLSGGSGTVYKLGHPVVKELFPRSCFMQNGEVQQTSIHTLKGKFILLAPSPSSHS